MEKIVGVDHKQGTGTDRNTGKEFVFDNYYIYSLKDERAVNVNGVGFYPQQYKVKAEKFSDLLSMCKVSDMKGLLDREIQQVYYDQWKNPVVFILK